MVTPADKKIEIIVPPQTKRSSKIDNVQQEIERLRRRCIVELEHVQQFHLHLAWRNGQA